MCFVIHISYFDVISFEASKSRASNTSHDAWHFLLEEFSGEVKREQHKNICFALLVWYLWCVCDVLMCFMMCLCVLWYVLWCIWCVLWYDVFSAQKTVRWFVRRCLILRVWSTIRLRATFGFYILELIQTNDAGVIWWHMMCFMICDMFLMCFMICDVFMIYDVFSGYGNLLVAAIKDMAQGTSYAGLFYCMKIDTKNIK